MKEESKMTVEKVSLLIFGGMGPDECWSHSCLLPRSITLFYLTVRPFSSRTIMRLHKYIFALVSHCLSPFDRFPHSNLSCVHVSLFTCSDKS